VLIGLTRNHHPCPISIPDLAPSLTQVRVRAKSLSRAHMIESPPEDRTAIVALAYRTDVLSTQEPAVSSFPGA
jgi:hypothetical protein